jgi:hypothetical protein
MDDEMQDDPEQCDCCHYEAADLESYKTGMGEGDKRLCEFCANTFLSSIVENPAHYETDPALARSIGWIANRLLDEIRKGKQD